MSGPDEPSYDDDPQLRERLRAADPAASLPPAEPDRVARLLEAAMSTTDHDTTGSGSHAGPEAPRTRRSPLTWIAAAAAVLVVGGVALTATMGGDDEETPTAGGGGAEETPAVLTLAAPAAQQSRCMVPNAEVLAAQEVAFLGTVEELADDTVVLEVDEQYAGTEADEVRVESPPEQMQLLAGAVDFREGEQYLVSATDGRVTVCGFSGPATGELQTLYSQAFGE
ncbi:hypothetical protein GGQ22_12700 [Nocardioides sp. zg-579]|uniref:Uncharacterized protein n=1 Tax=Nocardioides marmotae TaxID=2663857 RepID=A0A6I3JCW5_9ACTN|nr:hypothetical protein [Nocardioides marmotae]MCR6032291.1 hypothetical protein [Gordonia jinghuaiqii]MTB95939.1 hypothetical protein [Nocardioides marmotae]QKE02724.1 hypothetical protein HPC71_17835 [Nocardioides marmotae]